MFYFIDARMPQTRRSDHRWTWMAASRSLVLHDATILSYSKPKHKWRWVCLRFSAGEVDLLVILGYNICKEYALRRGRIWGNGQTEVDSLTRAL
jgi:hypothetical protein